MGLKGNREKILFYVTVTLVISIFLGSVSGILTPFVLAGVLAYLLDPLVDKTEKYIPRGITSGIIVFFVVALIAFIISSTIPALLRGIQELVDFLTNNEAGLRDKILLFLNSFLPMDIDKGNIVNLIQTNSKESLIYLTELIRKIAFSTFKLFDFISIFFITPIALFYMLKDWDKMMSVIEALLPKGEKNYINQLFRKINAKLSNFIRGQFMVCMFLGTFYAIGLYAVGLKLGILVGFLTGLFSFMPYVGLSIGAFAAFILAYLQFPLNDPTPFALMAGVFISGQILEGTFVSPKLVGKALNLHPLWIIFAVLAGGELKGFLGILIALPASAVISVLLKEFVNYYKTTKIYNKAK